MDERELKRNLLPILEEYFIVKKEVPGRHLIYGTKGVRIDFLVQPKKELFSEEVSSKWIGIEVKSPDVKEPKKNGLAVAWQAVTYAQSDFEGITPAMVVIYPPISEFFPNIKALNEDTGRHYNFNEGHWLRCFLQKANVGSFIVHRDNRTWHIEGGPGATWLSHDGESELNAPGTHRYIGSGARLPLDD